MIESIDPIEIRYMHEIAFHSRYIFRNAHSLVENSDFQNLKGVQRLLRCIFDLSKILNELILDARIVVESGFGGALTLAYPILLICQSTTAHVRE